MVPFLEKIADYYLSLKEALTGNICIVTPNRRAALYIRSHTGKKISDTIWAPDILSIEEFINMLSGLRITDNITLLMEFYRVLKNKDSGGISWEKGNGTDGIDFEEILKWVPVLLNDFDDIDRNLEDPSALFENLTEIKKIRTWSPDGKLTSFQERYIRFFSIIPQYHKLFKESLLSQGIAYQGLSNCVAASEIEKIVNDIPYRRVIFAGLNALSQSEEKIISTLLYNDKAVVIWDADEYYLYGESGNVKHEAGMFIRKYSDKWRKNSMIMAETGFRDRPKNINILGIAKKINQVQLAGNIILSRIPEEEHEDTAIVLADEGLMLPVLGSLPENVKKANVTMGYPLSYTAFYSFAESILATHIGAVQRRGDDEQKQPAFYYKDILTILKHPHGNILFDEEEDNVASDVSNAINRSNRSFYTLQQLKDICGGRENGLFEKLFSMWYDSPAVALDFFRETLVSLEEHYYNSVQAEDGSGFSVDQAAFNRFSLLINRFEIYQGKYGQPATLQSFQRIFRNLVALECIPFSGEPLEGLQIMGLLETRNLDFKNLVILSVNESILPKGKTQNSFIPFDMKVEFGLNTHRERDAIYAYHFYRLLQRAENVFLIYNTEADNTGAGEKSRFITQIEYELKEYNSDIEINHEVIPVMVDFESPPSALKIEKTADIIEKIERMGEKGYSPSALTIFLRCSLRFYLQKIMNIEEREEVEETIELKTLGLAIHDVLENIFKPYVGTLLKEEHLDIDQGRIEDLLRERFGHYYRGGDIDTGKNYLLYRVALRMILNYLRAERNDIRLRALKNSHIAIVSLEKLYLHDFPVKIGNGVTVRITGKVDRVDKAGDLYRVIDYKTGKVNSGDLRIKRWDELLEKADTEKSFQLLCYSWLFFKEKKDAGALLPSIRSFRNPGYGLFEIRHPAGNGGIITRNDIEEFEQNVLKPVFLELYDPGKPFRQTDNEENCRYCPFTILCGRNR